MLAGGVAGVFGGLCGAVSGWIYGNNNISREQGGGDFEDRGVLGTVFGGMGSICGDIMQEVNDNFRDLNLR